MNKRILSLLGTKILLGIFVTSIIIVLGLKIYEVIGTDSNLSYQFTKVPAMTNEDLYKQTIYINPVVKGDSVSFDAFYILGGGSCDVLKLKYNNLDVVLDCQDNDGVAITMMVPYKVSGVVTNLPKGVHSLSIQYNSTVLVTTEFTIE